MKNKIHKKWGKIKNKLGKIIDFYPDGKPYKIQTFPLKGEVIVWNKPDMMPPSTHLCGYKKTRYKRKTIKEYHVHGELLDVKTNTCFFYHKMFEDKRCALAYMDTMIREHPSSTIDMVQKAEHSLMKYT